MKKYIRLICLSLIFIFISGCLATSNNSSYSPRSSYERFIDCQLKATQKFRAERKFCYGDYVKGRYEQAQCMAPKYRMYVAENCSPEMSVSLNSISFMWRKLADVYDSANSKLYSNSRKEKIWNDMLVLINEEEEIAVAAGTKDLNNRKADFYEARANRNFERSMAILGAQVRNSSNQSSPTNRTYILNGKIINCTSFDNLTNCN